MRSHPLLLLAALACSPTNAPDSAPAPAAAERTPGPATPPPSRKPPRDADIWVARTDAELDAALQRTCDDALATGRPVLLQFSASWCIDCKRMHAMSSEPPLRDALSGWSTIIIDPGRFELHKELLQAFGVSRLATWVALAPEDCRLPAPAWRRLASSSFEPVTGEPVGPERLVAWLDAARAGTGSAPVPADGAAR